MKFLINLWKLLLDNPWRPGFVCVLLAVNALGSAYGYYWYREQLAATPLVWWLFVPDSPLSTTLFAAVLFLSLLGRRILLLELIAYAYGIKYGLWAVIVISDFWLIGGGIEPPIAMLWISHMGMAAQGLVYLRTLRPSPWNGLAVAGVLACMLLNDFVDYCYKGIYPYLYYQGQEPLAAVSAVGLSIAVTVLVLYFVRKVK